MGGISLGTTIKTGQVKVGAIMLSGKLGGTPGLRSVKALHNAVKVNLALWMPKGKVTGPVFAKVEQDDVSALTMSMRFHRKLSEFGAQHEFYSIHSFRSGGATAAGAGAARVAGCDHSEIILNCETGLRGNCC